MICPSLYIIWSDGSYPSEHPAAMPLLDTPSLPALDLFRLNGQVALVTGASRGTQWKTSKLTLCRHRRLYRHCLGRGRSSSCPGSARRQQH